MIDNRLSEDPAGASLVIRFDDQVFVYNTSADTQLIVREQLVSN